MINAKSLIAIVVASLALIIAAAYGTAAVLFLEKLFILRQRDSVVSLKRVTLKPVWIALPCFSLCLVKGVSLLW